MSSRSEKAVLKREDTPALLGLTIVILTLFLFGADAPASSLAVTTLSFLAAGICLLSYEEMHLKLWTAPFLIGWGVFCWIHFTTGRTVDGEHEYLVLLAGGCLYWLGRHGALSRRRRRRIFTVIALFGFVFGLSAFLQHIIAPDHVLGLEKKYHVHRLTGPFLSANTAATFVGILLLFSAFHMLQIIQRGGTAQNSSSLPPMLRWLVSYPITLCSIPVLATCLLLTASRAGFFAVGLSLVFLLLGFAFSGKTSSKTETRSHSLSIPLVAVTLAIAGFTIWSLSGSLLDARFDHLDRDFLPRQVMFDASWQAGKNAPWLGHGLNSLSYATAFASDAETNRYIITQNASHNLFAQWFMQAGWLGLGLLGCLITILAWSTLTSSAKPLRRAFTLSLIILVIAHGIFDYAMEIPAVFLFLSLMLGLNSSPKKR